MTSISLSAALFLGAFALYLKTLAPTVTFGDSGELIAAINCLGVPHPTGFPLFMLLGKLFSMLPFANPAFRVNVMSAVFAACVPVALFNAMLLLNPRGKSAAVRLAIPFMASALMIFTYTLWSQSSMTRIYSLNALFCAAALYIFFLMTENGATNRLYYFFAFITGLGAGLHLTFAVTAGIMWCFIVASDVRRFFKNLFWILVFFAAGMSVYIFVLVRGAGDAQLQWSKITTSDEFYNYFTQQQYKRKMLSRSLAGFGAYFEYIWKVVLRELSPVGLILMALGAAAGFFKRARYTLALTLIFAANIIILSLYGNYSDLKLAFRYLIPSYAAGVVLVYFFLEYLASLMKNKPAVIAVAAALCVTAVSASLRVNLYENDKSRDCIAYFFAKDMLESVPEPSYLFASGDNQIYPMAYYKYVLKRRPGVRVMDTYPSIFKDVSAIQKDNGGRPDKLTFSIIKATSMGFKPIFSSTPLNVKALNESQCGLVYYEADVNKERYNYPWPAFSLKGILNDNSFYNDFEEREVVGTYLYRLGTYYKAMNRPELYSWLLDKSGEKAYDSMAVLTNLGIMFTQDTSLDKNFSKAELMFRQAEKIDPENTDFLFNFGSFYGIIGAPEKAAKYFDRVLKIDPNNLNARLYYNRAVAQVQQEYERQVKLGKEQIMHYEAGVQYFNNKKLVEAKSEFEEDLKANPNLPRSYFYLALICSVQKDFKGAIPLYEKALKFDPNNVGTMNNLGLCYMNLKQYKEAIEYFKYSLEVKPGQERIEKILAGLEKKVQ